MNEGKVILVTGASRGIGRGIALALVQEGATVFITGRHSSAATRGDGLIGGLDETCSEINKVAKHGGSCSPIVCDHSSDSAVEAAIDHVFSSAGKLDVLVNNAFGGVDFQGGDLRAPFWEKPLWQWDAFHKVGLRSHYTALSLVTRKWVAASQTGLVLNIGSAAGAGYVFDVAYGVGKAGVDRLTADAAAEFKQREIDITVVSVWPGAVRTEVVEKNLKEGLIANPEIFTVLESVEFCGRGISHLVVDDEVKRFAGKVVLTPELAEEYDFTDIDGQVPWGAHEFMRGVRVKMGHPPSQWQKAAPRQSASKKQEGEDNDKEKEKK